MSPSDERTWAMLAHLAGLVVPLGWLIVYLVYRERSAFVRRHAAEATNFHLSLLIYQLTLLAVAIPVALVTFGIGLFALLPILLVIGVVSLVYVILAAIAANAGRDFRYPLTIRMIS